jgi:sugar O-acyltransferase (sialic acid O-acetyltransferase NeuD family)
VRRLVIFGAGGTCVDILDSILDINDAAGSPAYECLGFLDDDPLKIGRRFLGREVLGPLASAPQYTDVWFVNGIGSPTDFWKKREIIARSGVGDGSWATLLHPSARVSRSAELGAGTVVLQNVTIGTNVRVGRHVIILPNSVVSHDAVVGDFTCIAGGACISGAVTIGEACYVGSNATLREGIRIGPHAMIGMGSVVLEDVPERTVVVGAPARIIRSTY